MRGNTLNNIYIILIEKKTLLGYYVKTLSLYRKISKIFILPYLLLKLFIIFIYCLYNIIYLSLTPFLIFYFIYIIYYKYL